MLFGPILSLIKLGFDLALLLVVLYLGVKAQQKYPSVIAKIPFFKPAAAATVASVSTAPPPTTGAAA